MIYVDPDHGTHNGIRNAILTDDIMIVANKGWVEGTIVQDTGRLYIESGGNASQTIVSSVGEMGGFYVYTDGKAINTTISSGGALWLSGGLVETTEVLGNGYFNIYSGSATSTTIKYGTLFLFDGKATDIQLNRGGLMVVSGGTADNAVVSGTLLLNGGQVNSATVGFEGLMRVNSGVANHTEVRNGKVLLNSGGTISSTTVYNFGNIQFFDGGTTYDTVIDSDGRMVVNNGGTANRTTVNASGSMDVYSDGVANHTIVNEGGILTLSLGGVANSAAVSSGGTIRLESGAVANDIRVYEGGKLSLAECSLNRVTVNSGGTAVLYYKEVNASEVNVNGGEIHVLDSGVMSQGVASKYLAVQNNGNLVISHGGTVDGAIVKDHGHVTVKNDAVFANATVTSADVTAEAYATVSGLTLSSGGVLYGSSGAKIQDTTVSSSGILNVSGAKIQNTTVSSGGSVTGVLRNASGLVFAGGTLDLNIAKASVQGGSIVDSASYASIKTGTCDVTLTVANKQLNGTYYLIDNATDFNATVTVKFGNNNLGTLTAGGGPTDVGNITCDLKLNNAGTLVVVVTNGAIPNPIYSGATLTDERKDITSGMSAIDVTVSSGGILNVYSNGVASNITVYKRGEFNVHSDGDLRGASVRYGGTATIYEDVMASSVIVDGGVFVIESDGWAYRTSGGKLVSSNTIVKNGGMVIVSGGGFCSGVVVSDGGHAIIESGGNFGAATVTNGDVTVKDGVESAGATLLDGGVMVVQAGGSAGCTVSSGGIVKVESGGYLKALTVNTGGVVTGVLHDIYTVFRMYGGTLDLDISNAAPGGEFLMDDDAFFDPNEDFNCTLTVDGLQENGTYNLMEYAYEFDTKVITAESPLTVKSTSGATLGTLAVGETAEIGDATYTLNLSDDCHLTVTISEGASEPTPPPTPMPGSAKSDINANGISDVMFQYTGGFGQIGFWMDGTSEWKSTNATHPVDVWEVLGAYDMNANGKADSVLVGNTEISGIKGAFIGYYTDAEDYDSNWVNISYLTNSEGYVWKNKVGNLTGNEGMNSIVWHCTELGALGVWTDGTDSWVGLGAGYDSNWTLVGCGDFTGSGKDSVVMSYMGGAKYYTVGIDGVSAELASSDSGWEVRAIGDFAGDGKDDIVAFHKETGLVAMWSDGDSSGSNWSQLGQLDVKDWFVVGAGDYDGNGKDDLLVRQYSTGMLGYYAAGDMSAWTELGRGVDMSWTVIA